MKKRKVGNSTLNASVLGIGALHFGTYCDQAMTSRIIHKAIEVGINFIDTAPMYGEGNSETFVKNAVRGCRDQVLLTTKVGLEPRIQPDGRFECSIIPLSKERIRASLEKSLKALGTDYIDLFQVHAFDPTTPIEETMEILGNLVKEGKVRYIGCSNYDGDNLNTAMAAVTDKKLSPWVSLQTQYNLLERRAERDIVPSCHAYNIGLICNRALARGILSGKYQVAQPLPKDSRAMLSVKVKASLSDEVIQAVNALKTFSEKYSRKVIELAIAWLLARPQVSIVLVGVRNINQLEKCVMATDWSLSEDELKEIDVILAKHHLLSRAYSVPEVLIN